MIKVTASICTFVNTAPMEMERHVNAKIFIRTPLYGPLVELIQLT